MRDGSLLKVFVLPEDLPASVQALRGEIPNLRGLPPAGFLARLGDLVEPIWGGLQLGGVLRPFDVNAWFDRCLDTAWNRGRGILRWPEVLPDRIIAELQRLRAISEDYSRFRIFCVAFCPAGSLPAFPENVPGFITLVVERFLADFAELMKDEYVSVEGEVGVLPERGPASQRRDTSIMCSSDAPGELGTCSADDLHRLRLLKHNYTHFVDAAESDAKAEVQDGGSLKRSILRPGHVSVLIAAVLHAVSEEGPIDFDEMRLPNVTTDDSGRRTFYDLRQKIDGKIGADYALFKARRKPAGRAQCQEFAPSDGVTYCFLFRVEDVQAIRYALFGEID